MLNDLDKSNILLLKCIIIRSQSYLLPVIAGLICILIEFSFVSHEYSQVLILLVTAIANGGSAYAKYPDVGFNIIKRSWIR